VLLNELYATKGSKKLSATKAHSLQGLEYICYYFRKGGKHNGFNYNEHYLPRICTLHSWLLSANNFISNTVAAPRAQQSSLTPLTDILLELTQGVLRCDVRYGPSRNLFGTVSSKWHLSEQAQREDCQSQPVSEEVEIEYKDPIFVRFTGSIESKMGCSAEIPNLHTTSE
jgi:hypothetical protein